MKASTVPPSRFQYEPGNDGGPGRGYVPSIIGYKEVIPGSWSEHLCLVKRDATFENQETSTSIAGGHLAAARQAQLDGVGSPQKFALSLRHEGYKIVSDCRIVKAQA